MRLLRNSSRPSLCYAMGAFALLGSLCGVGNAQSAPPADPGGVAVPASAPAGAPSEAAPPAAAAPVAATGQAGSPAGSSQVASSSPVPTEGGYTVRLRSLEKNVNELKEQIFRTKARLNLLKETVLGGTLGASRAVIHHKNEMGTSYSLIKAVYALDGVQIYSKSDESGRLAEMKEFDIYNGAIQPGSHTLTVMMVYQGNGYGVFSYLKGYKMTVRSSHTFVAGEAKSTAITVVGYEKGNITTNLQDRPAVDFRVSVMSVEPAGVSGNSGPTSSATSTGVTK